MEQNGRAIRSMKQLPEDEEGRSTQRLTLISSCQSKPRAAHLPSSRNEGGAQLLSSTKDITILWACSERKRERKN